MKSASSQPLVIGLAGGIGSGKSLVASVLGELGAAIIDSDLMAHEELNDGEVVSTLRGWWGDRVCNPDGSVNRKVMANIIFEDPEQRERLQGFLYPRLETKRTRMMADFSRDPRVEAVVVNSPLLYEVGLDAICDVVVFVACDRADRVARVCEARGWTAEELDRREKLQKPLDIKERLADHVLGNNSTIEALRSQTKKLFDLLMAKRRRVKGVFNSEQ